MKQIHITRDSSGVKFETVSIDVTDTVFFTNLDAQSAHWPDITTNELGAAPSANSSQVPVDAPDGQNPPCVVTYGCKLHANEKGTINLFNQLSKENASLDPATAGTAIAEQQVVSGGSAPYSISGQLFQITDANNNVIQSGSGIGPGLQLNPKTSELGITVTGTPTVVGKYNFTFTVNDAMGKNLQQSQYSMVVNAGA